MWYFKHLALKKYLSFSEVWKWAIGTHNDNEFEQSTAMYVSTYKYLNVIVYQPCTRRAEVNYL